MYKSDLYIDLYIINMFFKEGDLLLGDLKLAQGLIFNISKKFKLYNLFGASHYDAVDKLEIKFQSNLKSTVY